MDRRQCVRQAAAGGLECRPLVGDGAEAELGVEQRILLDHPDAGGELGAGALQELEAGGGVGEEVAHLHHGSRRGTGWTLLEDLPGPDPDSSPA